MSSENMEAVHLSIVQDTGERRKREVAGERKKREGARSGREMQDQNRGGVRNGREIQRRYLSL